MPVTKEALFVQLLTGQYRLALRHNMSDKRHTINKRHCLFSETVIPDLSKTVLVFTVNDLRSLTM